MTRSIKLETTYPHSIEKVWAAITSAEAMSQWLMPNDFEARTGHHFQFRTTPRGSFDGIVNCEVLEIINQQKLVYSWDSSDGGLKTIVTFLLEDLGDHTRLKFEHTGFDGILNRLIARNILAMGWKRKILTKLLPDFLNQK